MPQIAAPVVLIMVDGLRLDICQSGQVFSQIKHHHFLPATSVYPSNTLPCHASLFTSVVPSVHGVMHNDYQGLLCVPSLWGVLKNHQVQSAIFYSWKPLATLWSGLVSTQFFMDCEQNDGITVDTKMVEKAKTWLTLNHFDFMFFYFSAIDLAGHRHGWLSDEYLDTCEQVETLLLDFLQYLPKTAKTIITSDHGGHQNNHGSELADDINIPIWLNTTFFSNDAAYKAPNMTSILDIAPTILDSLVIEKPTIWQGQSLLQKNNVTNERAAFA